MSKKDNKKRSSLKNEGSKKEKIERMKREYLALHKSGLSPCEIAERTGVSKTTVYRYLDEIAMENAVERETLLVEKKIKKLVANTEELVRSTDSIIEKHMDDSEELYRHLVTMTIKLEKSLEDLKKSQRRLSDLNGQLNNKKD